MDLLSTIRKQRDLYAIVQMLQQAGGQVYLVGGCVRDALLGRESQNFDLEVFGLTSSQIIHVLSPTYEIDRVGKSYGILKVRHFDIDIGVPRTEIKTGTLHTDFSVKEDPYLPIEEAIRRRDFTLNAIYYDLQNGKFIDPFDGQSDLAKGILRHTSERFIEDPLRVLRGMQFCARFQLTAVPETVALCRTLSLEALSPERIYQEFLKLILKGQQISLGLRFLRATNWVKFFPEIDRLIGLKQDPIRHPEGDVFEHICHVMDAFAQNRLGDEQDNLTVGFALLCHDFGKAATTFRDAKGIHSYWHEIAGILPARTFMERLRVPKEIMVQALTLVQYHMEPRRFFKKEATDADIRRLAYNVRRLDLLALVGYCDCFGRVENNEEIYNWFLGRARELGVLHAPPRAIIQGRHLIEIGLTPSEQFSKILLQVYHAQLNGAFSTLRDGLQYIQRLKLPFMRVHSVTPEANPFKQKCASLESREKV